MLDRRALLTNGTAMVPLITFAGRAFAQAGSETRYGMIEIGSSGVKVNAYQFSRQAVVEDDATAPSGRERFAPSRVGKGYTVNTSVINGTDKDIDDTAQVAGEAMTRLTSSEFGVLPENIAVVASSGVASFPNIVDRLSGKVYAATHKTMDTVDPAEESKLSYDWIVYKHRRQQVLLIDVGSGNTKGGYYEQVGTPQQRFRDFSVPLGTKSFANAIRKAWPNDPVAARALPIFESQYLPQLNSEIASAPGMITRPRIYLSGGIFWATAWLTQTAQMAKRSDWVHVHAQDFEALGKLLGGGDAYRQARETPMTPAELDYSNKQLTSVAETFAPDQLAAGNALCRALAQRLDFNSRSAIFFASFAVDAWSSQYLVKKFHSEQLEG